MSLQPRPIPVRLTVMTWDFSGCAASLPPAPYNYSRAGQRGPPGKESGDPCSDSKISADAGLRLSVACGPTPWLCAVLPLWQ
jgi:hypothetical protein